MAKESKYSRPTISVNSVLKKLSLASFCHFSETVFIELSADAVCEKDTFLAIAANSFHLATQEEAAKFYDTLSQWTEPYDQFTIQDSNADMHSCRRTCVTL